MLDADKIKAKYTNGTKIKLIKMIDKQAVPSRNNRKSGIC